MKPRRLLRFCHLREMECRAYFNAGSWIDMLPTFYLIRAMKSLQLCWLFLLFCSCQLRNEPVTEGNEIDPAVKREIDEMVGRIHKSMLRHDGSYISSILAEELKAQLVNYNEKIEQIVDGVQLDTQNYLRNTVLEQHINNGFFNRITKVRSEEGNFSYLFPRKPQTYVKLFAVSSATSYEKYLISTIFFRERGKWKLGSFYVGPYSYYGQNADDLYATTSTHFYNNKFVLAYLYAHMMLATINPASGNLKFDKEDIMRTLAADAGEKMKSISGMPAVVEKLATRPDIFDLRVRLSHRLPSPMVYYRSSVPLSNTAALEEENVALHKIIEDYLPDAKAIFDSVYYVAVNEYPNEYREVEHVSFSRLAEVGK
jgi:hypothetical protein